jgi:hypothetical protein
MDIETLSENRPKARKEYRCMAYEWIQACGINDAVEIVKTFSEKRAIVEMRNKRGRIQKGEIHICARIKQDGNLVTFRANVAMDEIARKYDFYDYD